MDRTRDSTVEFTVGPHGSRRGWKIARIIYDPTQPSHQRQIHAALDALITTQLVTEQAEPSPEALAAVS